MRPSSKKISLYLFFAIVSGIFAYLFMFYLSVIDISNVKVEGYVFDKKSGKPIENVLVIVNNERYEDDEGNSNYDEFFGHDIIKLHSNEKGYYSASIKKSAFVWIEFSKNDYLKKSEQGQYAKKRMHFKTYLTKKQSNKPND